MVMKSLLTLAIVGCAFNAVADQELENLKKRVAELEKQQTTSSNWAGRISFEGLVEAELIHTDSEDFSDESGSDLAVATVELGIGAQINDSVSANVVFLYEEDDTDFEVDVATIDFANAGGLGIDVSVGQMYTPFGAFETNMVNDTLVLELAETRETAALVGWASGGLNVSGYIFNGDVDPKEDNTLANIGISTGFATEEFSVGLDYISNVYDTDAISEETGIIDDSEGAYIIRAAGSLAGVSLMAEYFQADELEALGDIEPEAFQVEAAIELGDWTFALAVQETDEAVFLGLPENRISISAGTELYENVSFAIEVFRDEDYDEDDGGTDATANSILAQIAVSF